MFKKMLTFLMICSLTRTSVIETNSKLLLFKENISNTLPQGCIQIYDSCDFKGTSITICNDVFDTKQLDFSNKIKSIRVAHLTEVRLYKKINLDTKIEKIHKDENCIDGKSPRSFSIQRMKKKKNGILLKKGFKSNINWKLKTKSYGTITFEGVGDKLGVVVSSKKGFNKSDYIKLIIKEGKTEVWKKSRNSEKEEKICSNNEGIADSDKKMNYRLSFNRITKKISVRTKNRLLIDCIDDYFLKKLKWVSFSRIDGEFLIRKINFVEYNPKIDSCEMINNNYVDINENLIMSIIPKEFMKDSERYFRPPAPLSNTKNSNITNKNPSKVVKETKIIEKNMNGIEKKFLANKENIPKASKGVDNSKIKVQNEVKNIQQKNKQTDIKNPSLDFITQHKLFKSFKNLDENKLEFTQGVATIFFKGNNSESLLFLAKDHVKPIYEIDIKNSLIVLRHNEKIICSRKIDEKEMKEINDYIIIINEKSRNFMVLKNSKIIFNCVDNFFDSLIINGKYLGITNKN